MSDPLFGSVTPRPMPLDLLKVCHFSVKINTPPPFRSYKLLDDIPTHAPTPAYRVSELAAAPVAWRNGLSALRQAYVCSAQPGHLLWLNFNANLSNSYDVAVRIFLQGVCALTGDEADEDLSLKKLPRGNRAGSPHNYLASTGSQGYFWLDEFCTSDGTAREFVFTDDVLRGDAAQLRLEFYRSVEQQPFPFVCGDYELYNIRFQKVSERWNRRWGWPDPYDLSFWETAPAATMVIHYVSESALADLVARSSPPREDSAAGLMAEL